jgi:acetyl-CoA carboxylase biotin carboxyl carrier protein
MNIKELKEMVKMLDGTDIVEFTYENEGTKVAIKKGNNDTAVYQTVAVPAPPPAASGPAVVAQAAALPAQTPSTGDTKNEGLGPNQVLIVAPMVGTFYRAPSPDAEPFVQVGQVIEAGQVVCIIEAMKLMNEIESEWKGKVLDVLSVDNQPVEYGQPLLVLEKI